MSTAALVVVVVSLVAPPAAAVAVGFYDHGTRFLEISSKGKVSEAGYFLRWRGSTSAAYWVTDEIVYSIDYERGLDILKFKDTG